MKAQRLQRVVCAILFGAVGGVAHAAVPAAAPPGALTNAQAFDADVIAMAAQYELPVKEARRRLSVEQQAADVMEKLPARFKSRLAGAYIDHGADGTSRLVVRLTGQQAERTQFKHAGADTLEVAFVPGASHTLAQLRTAIDQVPAMSATLPSVSRYIDDRTGEVVIEVEAAQLAKTADVSAARDSAASVLGVPVRIEAGEAPIVNAVFGSGRLNPVGCTTGFAVYHAASNQNGILTAGHCRLSSGFHNYVGHPTQPDQHLLGQQNWLQNANADLLWLGNTSVGFGGYFYSDSWRAVTGRRTQGATVTGTTYCKYGIASGYNCGTVQAAYAAAGNLCGPNNNQACNASFVRVGGTSASLCLPGDSGGPWFTAGTIAAGIHFSSNNSGSLCWYTTTDYAYSGLGLALLYP